MNDQRRDAIRQKLELIGELKAVPKVKPHDSRFENEIALVAPAAVTAEVDTVVQRYLGEPTKPAGKGLPLSLKFNSVIRALGGIRKEQTLYMVALDEVVTFYVAYWPWGGGERFTIKVGVHLGKGAADEDEAALSELLAG